MIDQADWWRRAVIYQIYPRSFQDSDGDGIGDLRGIISRLDYVRDLGVDGIWLSPTFPSPMKDFGYDVADYCGVDPTFGTLDDMDALIEGCHARGLKLLLDWVPNHTSDQHPWFLDSRSSLDNPRRDWYFWRDPSPEGGLPNNWLSNFGGPAWTLDEATPQYYLHSFLKEQPDLNWRNPDVEKAMHDVLRFWLDRGVDGFRMDVIGMILKHPELADNPPNPRWLEGMPEFLRYLPVNNRNFPGVIEKIRGLRSVLDEYPERMAVGEVYGTAEEVAQYYGADQLDGLHMTFNFNLIVDRSWRLVPWRASAIAQVVVESQATLPSGAQACWAIGNHDQPRFVNRHNEDGWGEERARAAALLVLALTGTPFLYYGDELGMLNGGIPEARLQDPARFRARGRDPERIPMPWDASSTRGFSTGEPWLPYGPAEINVADQDGDPSSLLNLNRRALAIRRGEASLNSGGFRPVAAKEDLYVFQRRLEGSASVLVLLNTSVEPASTHISIDYSKVLLASTMDAEARLTKALQRAARTRDGQVEVTIPGLAAAWLTTGEQGG